MENCSNGIDGKRYSTDLLKVIKFSSAAHCVACIKHGRQLSASQLFIACVPVWEIDSSSHFLSWCKCHLCSSQWWTQSCGWFIICGVHFHLNVCPPPHHAHTHTRMHMHTHKKVQMSQVERQRTFIDMTLLIDKTPSKGIQWLPEVFPLVHVAPCFKSLC